MSSRDAAAPGAGLFFVTVHETMLIESGSSCQARRRARARAAARARPGASAAPLRQPPCLPCCLPGGGAASAAPY